VPRTERRQVPDVGRHGPPEPVVEHVQPPQLPQPADPLEPPSRKKWEDGKIGGIRGGIRGETEHVRERTWRTRWHLRLSAPPWESFRRRPADGPHERGRRLREDDQRDDAQAELDGIHAGQSLLPTALAAHTVECGGGKGGGGMAVYRRVGPRCGRRQDRRVYGASAGGVTDSFILFSTYM